MSLLSWLALLLPWCTEDKLVPCWKIRPKIRDGALGIK